MATEIEIDTIINTDRSEQGLIQLQKGLKDLISLQGQVGSGSAQFKKLQQAINDTEGQIGELNDSFQTLKGSGVDRLNSSLSLLREGFTGADPGKLKTAFNGLSAAMSAIPIFLLIEGLKFVAENFETVVNVVKSAIGVVDEQAAAQKRLNKELQETNFQLQDLGISYKYFEQNRQRALDLEIEKLKQRGAAQTEIDKVIIASEEAKLARLKKGRDEATNLGVQELTKYQDAVFEQQDKIDLLYAKTETNRVMANKAANEKLKAERDKKTKETLEAEQAEFDQLLQIAINNQGVEDQRKRDDKKAQDELDASRRAINAQLDEDAKNQRLANDKEIVASSIAKWDAEEKAAKKAADEAEQIRQSQLQFAQLNTQSLLNLSEAYFTYRSTAAKGDTAQQEKQAKKQFETFKKIQIAAAIISGIQGVINALTAKSTIPEPYGTIVKAATAVSIGAATALNISKIRATKFAESSASGGASASIGDVSTPQVNTPQIAQQTPGGDSNAFNPSGIANAQTGKNKDPQRVYVLESDIRNITNRVNVIESRATF
jgi:hypothetical protein